MITIPMLIALLCAQQADIAPPSASGQKQKLGAISGRVLSPDGGPLRHGRVLLFLEGKGIDHREVDRTGTFLFEDLEPGSYSLSAFAPGRTSEQWERTLQSGESVSDVILKTLKIGAISGKVTDEDGDPVEGAEVRLFLRYRAGGKFHWADQAREVHTDDRGEYRFADVWGEVAPAVRPTQWPISSTYSNGQNPLAAYPQTYYPGVTDLSLATPVDATSGADISGVDIRIRRVPSFRVAGRVFGLGGGVAPGIQVSLYKDRETDDTRIWHHVTTARDGTFAFASVMPGQYELMAVDSSGDGASAATQQIVVSTRNPDALKLQLNPTLAIAGVLKIEGQKKLTASGRRVWFGGRSAGNPDGVVKADGTFTLRNLLPSKGTFTIERDRRTYLRSMTYAGQDVAGREIDLRQGGAGPLEIVLSTDTASVSGTVVDVDRKPIKGAWVALVVGNVIEPWDGNRDGTEDARPPLDGRGHFAMEGLSPGRHRLIAWSMVEGYTPGNPENYADYILDIDLQPNSAKQVVLQCIPAEVVREIEARAGNPSQ